MKANREFYMYGNDRKFHDDYIISIMTGEPMPRKWQQFLELTPEEKARWDASLRLDAEYRRAEAQGFPNGIPGGRTRGNALYTFTQMEEEHERDLMKKRMEEALHPYGQYFSPYRTDIHDNTGGMFGNITPDDNLWQNPFDTWKNTDTSALSVPQTDNNPTLDPLGMRQAIQRLTESVRASMNHANQEPQTIETESRDNAAMAIPANDSAEPAAYDKQQVTDNAVPTQTSLQEKNNPLQFYAEDRIGIQMNRNNPPNIINLHMQDTTQIASNQHPFTSYPKQEYFLRPYIKKEPAFNVNQTIQDSADRSRIRWNHNASQYKILMPIQSNQNDSPLNEATLTDARTKLMQTLSQNRNNHLIYGNTSGIPNDKIKSNSFNENVQAMSLTDDFHKDAKADMPVWDEDEKDLIILNSESGLGETVTKEEYISGYLKKMERWTYGGRITVQPLLHASYGDVIWNEKSIYEIFDAIKNPDSNEWKNTPPQIRDTLFTTYDFLSSWGKQYGKVILDRLPLPIHVRSAIAAAVLAYGIYEVVAEVQAKREQRINDLKNITINNERRYTDKEAEAIADDEVGGWFMEEIGKTVFAENMERLMKSEKVDDNIQRVVMATWDAFVATAERRDQQAEMML